ncbi:hypothetical protein QVM48_22200 [Pseudomonas soli]|jgi:arginyl-tRNA synthetase|uniref:hypothetical protein n=1 Tax=Pseudomonas soli TaxID=1306993 RepID=UPI0028958CB4|nr:hypothetical protein [Pseudomonas soli]MDT3716270.1 hypothetical protein [Pseudomonas soli]MDT3732034.1 hypothetical protein [Pseudomonas soli]
MTDQKDFAALGKYVDAKERASGLESERHNLAGDIGRQLKEAVTGSSDYIRRFDHIKLVESAKQLQEINERLEDAIAEVNRYAEAAEKPVISRR